MKPITLGLGDPWIRTATGIRTDGPVGIGTSAVAGLSLSAANPIHAPAWTRRLAMTGNVVLTSVSATYQFLDPNGSDRDCTLPTPATGMSFVIMHIGAANNLVVKDAAAATLATLTAADDVATVIYDGTAWQVL